jgi:RecB family exonuclease
MKSQPYLYRRLTETEANLSALICKSEPDKVYWMETQANGNRVSLQVAPLHIGSLMQKFLWNEKNSVVLTSATLTAGGESRCVRLRGKADRVDLLADGRMRLIDYKLGRPPDNSIQLPVYALCLRQQLRREGRNVEIGGASYIAFGERPQPVEMVLGGSAKTEEVLAAAQEQVLSAIDSIERGDFPPRPAAPRLCGTCAYASVCRKDYAVAD